MADGDEPALMTCQELVELVTGYLEDALPPADRSRFHDHLQLCDPCVDYVEQARVTIGTLGRLTPAVVPPATERLLPEHFRGWKREVGDTGTIG